MLARRFPAVVFVLGVVAMANVDVGPRMSLMSPVLAEEKDNEPTKVERQLFDKYFKRVNDDKSKAPHAVDDVLKSFDKTVKLTITCPKGTKHEVVEMEIQTRLENRAASVARAKGTINETEGASLEWLPQDKVSKDGKKKIVIAKNVVSIDSDWFSKADEEKSGLGALDLERLIYHELLHGQLVIDAAKGTDDLAKEWQKKECNSLFDPSAVDKTHKIIGSLEQKFLTEIGKSRKNSLVLFSETAGSTSNGDFPRTLIGSLPEGKTTVEATSLVVPEGNIEGDPTKVDIEDGKVFSPPLKMKDPAIPTAIIIYIDPPSAGLIVHLKLNVPPGVSDVVVLPQNDTDRDDLENAEHDDRATGHVAMGQQADVVVIAPATANSIARLANGFADDLIGTTVLASHALLVIAPAMETHMWANPATQANVEVLRERGSVIVDPESGELASGQLGQSRLASLEAIGAAIEDALATSTALAGKRVIVTAGPTLEPMDPVRVVTNRSDQDSSPSR